MVRKTRVQSHEGLRFAFFHCRLRGFSAASLCIQTFMCHRRFIPYDLASSFLAQFWFNFPSQVALMSQKLWWRVQGGYKSSIALVYIEKNCGQWARCFTVCSHNSKNQDLIHQTLPHFYNHQEIHPMLCMMQLNPEKFLKWLDLCLIQSITISPSTNYETDLLIQYTHLSEIRATM